MEDKHIVWDVPKDQTMTVRIAPGTSGLLDADSFGRQLSAVSKLWIAAANTHSDLKWKTVLLDIKSDKKGGVTFKVALLPKKDELEKQFGAPTPPAAAVERGEG